MKVLISTGFNWNTFIDFYGVSGAIPVETKNNQQQEYTNFECIRCCLVTCDRTYANKSNTPTIYRHTWSNDCNILGNFDIFSLFTGSLSRLENSGTERFIFYLFMRFFSMNFEMMLFYKHNYLDPLSEL